MVGMFATAKAGHDKDKLYVIMREDEEYVYLVDGRIRTMDKPKKKNKKHIQIITKKSPALEQNQWNDLMIKRILKEYQKSKEKS